MVDPIGVGDWVECVDDSGTPDTAWLDIHRIYRGSIYRVSDAWTDAWGDPVILVGWERESANRCFGHRCGYWVHRFRPIYHPKQELIESLKVPAKRTRKREVAA